MTTTRHRDGWVMAGMAIAAASAATASFTGLRGLALAAGWPDRLAWLLPLTIDAYAMTSTRVWLAPGQTRRGRGFAQANAIGAIGASILGNAAYHMLSAGLLNVAWPIVVTVGAVPAAVLGLTAHLHALRTVEREPAPVPETAVTPEGAGPNTSDREGGQSPALPKIQDDPKSGTEDRLEYRTETTPQDRPEDQIGDRTRSRPDTAPLTQPRVRRRRRSKPRTEDELIQAARTADDRHRGSHDGRPITRDALRVALRISGPRATELRRQLAAEFVPAALPSAPNTSPPESNEPATTPDRKEADTPA